MPEKTTGEIKPQEEPTKPRELTQAEIDDGALYVDKEGRVIYKPDKDPQEERADEWRRDGKNVAKMLGVRARGAKNERRYAGPHT